MSWACASNGYGLDGCASHRCGSSCPPQGVENRERTTPRQERQIVPDLRNVRSEIEIACLSQPTDRPHVAAFILPSSVAAPRYPFSEVKRPQNPRRLATECNPGHWNCPWFEGRTNRPVRSGASVEEPAVDRAADWSALCVSGAGRASVNEVSARSANNGACRQGTIPLAGEASRSCCSEASSCVTAST